MPTPKTKLPVHPINITPGYGVESLSGGRTATISRSTRSPHSRTCAIAALPPEIVRTIFEDVQIDLLSTWRKLRDDNPTSYRYGDAVDAMDKEGLFLFPGDLFLVCKYWAEVLVSVPTFWTHVAVFVGPDFDAPTKGLSQFFQRSRSRPFDLVIFGARSSTSSGGHDAGLEERNIASILEQVNPHLPRCRSIYILTTMVSPLPLIHKYLTSDAPLLTSAILQVAQNHVAGPGKYLFVRPKNTFLAFPSLERLFIDGPAFHHTASYPELLWSHPHLHSLSIRDYKPDRLYGPIDVQEVLCILERVPNLRSVKLENTEFVISNDVIPVDLGISALTFSQIRLQVMHEFLRLCPLTSLQEICIRQSLIDAGCIPDLCPIVRLEYIPRRQPLHLALWNWAGSGLIIVGCPSFNDLTLKILTSPVDPLVLDSNVDEHTKLFCNNLKFLAIRFPDVTPAALKNLVLKRGRWIDYEDPDWKTSPHTWSGPAILHLQVREAGEMLCDDDMDWFSSHLISFGWTC